MEVPLLIYKQKAALKYIGQTQPFNLSSAARKANPWWLLDKFCLIKTSSETKEPKRKTIFDQVTICFEV